MSRGSASAVLLACFWSVAAAGGFQNQPLVREGDTAVEEATTEDKVDFSLHFNLFRNILSTTRSAGTEVAAVADGETSTPTIAEEHGARIGQTEDSVTGNSSAERYWQLWWRHWFRTEQSSSTLHTPTSLAWTTAIDMLHLNSERPTKSNVDVKQRKAAEACKPTSGSVDPEESGWQGTSISPCYSVMVASGGTKNPEKTVREPHNLAKENDFFHTFRGTKSGSLNKVSGAIISETNCENCTKVNTTRNYDAIIRVDDNSSTVTGITSTLFWGTRSGDRNCNVTKTKSVYNLGIKGSSQTDKASNFQDVDRITKIQTAPESEPPLDEAETISYGNKNDDSESSSFKPFDSAAYRPIINNAQGFRNDVGVSTVGTESMNASSLTNIPDEYSKCNNNLLPNSRSHYTNFAEAIPNRLVHSTKENCSGSALLLSAETSNSSFADRITIGVWDGSNKRDETLFVNSTQYIFWHFILEAFRALKERTLALINKLSRPIQKLGQGLAKQFGNMEPLTGYNSTSQKSPINTLSNCSKQNWAIDKSSTTRTRSLDGGAPSGGSGENTDKSGQVIGSKSSDAPIETTNNEPSMHHPGSGPSPANCYHIGDITHSSPKLRRIKRQITFTASERNRLTKSSEINADTGPRTKVNALSSDARSRTTKNCAWNYENALDYPEYFNRKDQTTTPQGIGLSPSKLWLEIKSWAASKAKLLNASHFTAMLHKKNNEDEGIIEDEDKDLTDDENEAEIVDRLQNNQLSLDYAVDSTETNYYDNRRNDGYDDEDYYDDDDETKKRNKRASEHSNVVASR